MRKPASFSAQASSSATYSPSNSSVRRATSPYCTVSAAPSASASSVMVGVSPRRRSPANTSTMRTMQIAATSQISAIAGARLWRLIGFAGMNGSQLGGDRLGEEMVDRGLHHLEERRRPDADRQHRGRVRPQHHELARIQVLERGDL